MQVNEAAQSRDRQFLDLIALGRQFREHRQLVDVGRERSQPVRMAVQPVWGVAFRGLSQA